MYRPVYTDKKKGKVRSAKNPPSSAHNQHARSAETAICFMKIKRLITLVIFLFSQLKCVFEQRRASHVPYLNANARNLLLSLIFRFDTCYVRSLDSYWRVSRKTRRTLHTCIYTGQILFWFSKKTKCLNFYVNLIELKCLSHLALNRGRRPEKNVFWSTQTKRVFNQAVSCRSSWRTQPLSSPKFMAVPD